MTLGQKIKKLRVDKGLTQKELADKVYVTFQTVSKWEKDENEPDVSTLRELAKLFDCSMDYLLSEDESIEEEEPEVVPVPTQVENKTIVIHQKEMHVCTRCGKDIPEDELIMEKFCVRPAGRGHHAEYRDDYYHKKCLELTKKEREAKARQEASEKASKAKKKCFGWSIAAAAIALAFFLLVFLIGGKEDVHPALAVLYSVLLAYAAFSAVYCILSGSYIADVFLWCAGLSIKFPGLIFSWDIDGFLWVIAMKILFAVLGFIIGVLALLFAVFMSMALGAVSFPFVLVHNIHTQYSDAL